MKAITFDKFGGPEVLYISDNIETPIVSDEEVLIKVHAAGVNRPFPSYNLWFLVWVTYKTNGDYSF